MPKKPTLTTIDEAEQPDQPVLIVAHDTDDLHTPDVSTAPDGPHDWMDPGLAVNDPTQQLAQLTQPSMAQPHFSVAQAGPKSFQQGLEYASITPRTQTPPGYPTGIDDRDQNGNTVLLRACNAKHEEAVPLLLTLKANPHITNKAHCNALMVASQRMDPETVELLVFASIASTDADAADLPAHANGPLNWDGVTTMLMNECFNGHFGMWNALHAALDAYDGTAGPHETQAGDAENAVLCGLETTIDP